MLRKLMKHELRATGRVIVPIILVLLCAALGARFSLTSFLDSKNNVLIVLGSLLAVAYSIAIAGLFIACLVLMAVRFYRNMMGDEGYLMFTLPVNVHQHIWSKLLTATIWVVLSGMAVILSASILVVGYAIDLGPMLREIKDVIVNILNMEELKLLVFALVSGLLTIMTGFMLMYAAMSIGCSFANNKLLCSFAAFFGLQFGGSFISGLLPSTETVAQFFHLSSSTETLIWIGIVHTGIRFGIFYLITTWFLRNRLNLE